MNHSSPQLERHNQKNEFQYYLFFGSDVKKKSPRCLLAHRFQEEFEEVSVFTYLPAAL